MFSRIKLCFSRVISQYKNNKLKFLLNNIIYIFLLLFMFILPSFTDTNYSSIPLLFAGFLCILIFIYIFLYGKFFIDKKIIFMIFFCIFCLFSSLINDINRLVKTPFLLTIIFIMFYEFFIQENQKYQSIKMIFYGLFCFSIYFFLSYFKEIVSLDFKRLGNIFGNENAIGLYFHLGIVIGIYLLLKNKKIIYLFMVGFMFLLGMTSGSKTYIFGVLIAFLVFIIFLFGKKRWYFTIGISIVGIIGLIIVINLPGFETLKTRLLDFLNFLGLANTGNVDHSSFTRIDMMISGLKIFSKRPIFGYGYEGFAYNSFYNTYSHNTLIELLCNFGLCGFVCFEYPLFSLLSQTKIDKSSKITKYMLIVSNLFYHFTGVLFSSKIFYISLAIMLALDKEEIYFEDKNKIFYLK